MKKKPLLELLSAPQKVVLMVITMLVILSLAVVISNREVVVGRAFGDTIAGAPTTEVAITGCQEIAAPGRYVIDGTMDVADADLTNNVCILITADNVNLRCTSGGLRFNGARVSALGVRISVPTTTLGVRLQGCAFDGFRTNSVQVTGSNTAGAGEGIVLQNNQVRQTSAFAVHVVNSRGVTLQGNTATAPVGFFVENSPGTLFRENVARGSSSGITIFEGSHQSVLERNVISGVDGNAVFMRGSNSVRLTGNTVSGSRTGLRLQSGTDLELTGNVLCQNTGVDIACETTTFSSNTGNFLDRGGDCQQITTGFNDCSQSGVNLCGNSIVDRGEDCDDGNNVNGDLCSSTCEAEAPPVCGDGVLQPDGGTAINDDEQCDDGGACTDGTLCTINGAACADGTRCVPQTETCPYGPIVACQVCNNRCGLGSGRARFCGNGIIDGPAEQCDGNSLNGATCMASGFGGGFMRCSAGCLLDTTSCTASPDPDRDGIGNDDDGSGVAGDNPCTGGATTNCDDNCPITGNSNQADFDGDGIGDFCDTQGSCTVAAGCLQQGDSCWSATGPLTGTDTCPAGPQCFCDSDTDNDGVRNVLDNCPTVANPGQEDTNNDGAGNACGRCGNGIVEGQEECDDGATCTNTGVSCVLGGAPCAGTGNVCGTLDADSCPRTCRRAVCGDGIQRLDIIFLTQPGYEACDDGNTINNDGCSNECRVAVCGDGIINVGPDGVQGNADDVEQCDDGNTVDNDYCAADCSRVTGSCGDGTQQGNEVCDDGNTNDGDSCSANCGQAVAVCGNGIVDAGEVCDDGNTMDNDYCAANCLLVTGSCGDAILQLNEACEDRNTVSGDYCSRDCQTRTGSCGDGVVQPGSDGVLGTADDYEQCDGTPGCVANCGVRDPVCGDAVTQPEAPRLEQCDDGVRNSDTTPDSCRTRCQSATCGDNIVDTGETCDDGNTIDGDGCAADCGVIVLLCGNGRMDLNEVCDDGNTAGNDYCSPDCSMATGRCGDGTQQGNEPCDDGNNINNDGCTNLCVLQTCGDGILNTGPDRILGTADDVEQCDDGNTRDGDYCAADCSRVTGSCGDGTLQTGETCDNGPANSDAVVDACRLNCQNARCGDGFRDTGETCDDGNRIEGDGCSADCTQGTVFCGDGVQQANEQCDDGVQNGELGRCNGVCNAIVCTGTEERVAGVCDCNNNRQVIGGKCTSIITNARLSLASNVPLLVQVTSVYRDLRCYFFNSDCRAAVGPSTPVTGGNGVSCTAEQDGLDPANPVCNCDNNREILNGKCTGVINQIETELARTADPNVRLRGIITGLRCYFLGEGC